MNSSRFLFIVALITFSCITLSQSIKCYTCDNKESCKKPNYEYCNIILANKTRAYLDFHHTGVNPNLTSFNYECFRETIKSTAGEYHYKGCMYSNIAGCSHPLRDLHTLGKYSRDCHQCSSKDGCNPAARAGISLWMILAAIAVGAVSRYM